MEPCITTEKNYVEPKSKFAITTYVSPRAGILQDINVYFVIIINHKSRALRISANIKTYAEGLRQLVVPSRYRSRIRRGPAYFHLRLLLVEAEPSLHRGQYGRPTYPPGKIGSSRLEGALCWLMGRRLVLSSVVGLLWMAVGPLLLLDF